MLPRVLGLLSILLVIGALVTYGLTFHKKEVTSHEQFSETFLVENPTIVKANEFSFENQKFRLFGTRTAESSQRCTDENNQEFTCAVRAIDNVERLIGEVSFKCILKRKLVAIQLVNCSLEEEDLASVLIQNGWLVADTKRSFRYIPEEYYARLRNLGLWKNGFVHPQKYMDDRRKLQERIFKEIMKDKKIQEILGDLK